MNRIKTLVILLITALPLAVNARPAPDGFADMVEKLTPAVVNISTTQVIKSPFSNERFQQFPPGHPFEQFNDFFEQFINPYQGDRKAQSLGSGFIISPDGYVVTNNHVIEEADEIDVILNDNTQYAAKIIGRDPKTDLALLKIEAETPLPYVEFGNSDDARVGDWVVVIGNPFGLGGTVTAGIISARARDINAGPFDDFIQTDAAINRGNSGGPLFNLDGEVIGINTAIFSPNGVGNVGIGFAVPSSLAEGIIRQLKSNGEVERGWLGVRIQDVTEEIAESMGIESENGALVAEVMNDSPAAEAGLETGDIILEFNNTPIEKMKQLPRVVAEAKTGQEVPVLVLRGGDRISLTVKVGELEEEEELSGSSGGGDGDNSEQDDGDNVLGMSLRPIDDGMRKRFGIAQDVTGLIVTGVKFDSPAGSSGIRRGDIVLEADQQKLQDAGQFADIVKQVKKSGRNSVLLLLQRAGDAIFMAVPVEG